MIVSTGQTNWAKEVTDVSGTLAYFIAEAHRSLSSAGSREDGDSVGAENNRNWPGFYDSKTSSRLMILNGSHRTASENSTHNTVIVLPDYTFVNEVPESFDGATDLWKSSLDPSVGRGGKVLTDLRGGSELKSWPMPYNIVILICTLLFSPSLTFLQYLPDNITDEEPGSHKRRDTRCGMTAPILEHGTLVYRVPPTQPGNLSLVYFIIQLSSRH